MKVNVNGHPSDGETTRRYVPFEGIENFRDMGGYDADGNRRVKWGRLFRSGQLSGLTPQDQAQFSAFEIGLICDFRYEEEVVRAPNNINGGTYPNIMHLPVASGSFRSFFKAIGVEKPEPEDMKKMMAHIYRIFVNDHAAAYADMFRHLLSDEKAVLIHCSAGKDRTGFGAAMILSALGVERDVIMEDYLLSTKYFSADRAMAYFSQQRSGSQSGFFDTEALRPLYEVHPEYLMAAFEEIEGKYGTVDQYLTTALALTPARRRRLKEKYLA